MNRDKIQNEYYKFLDILDPTKTNSKFYKDMFDNMSDKEFKDFVLNGILQVYQITGEVEISKRNAIKACEYMNIKPSERLALPHIFIDKDGKPLVTAREVLILRVTLRRLQQTVNTENLAASSITMRDKTNQVIGEDKAAQVSSDEVLAMIGAGYHYPIVELLTIRADHSIAKKEAYAQLLRTGECDIPESIHDPKSKVSLSYIDNLFLAAGVSTDLIEPLMFR